MYQGKSLLAVIPARSGSKGLPGKNIKPLCGKPLIAWTIERAQQSRYIDTIMFSTDSQEIANIAESCDLEIPLLRPAELALDTTSTLDVIRHAIDFYWQNFNKKYDYIVLLEPTSPLREPDDIDNMIVKLIDNQDHYDSIVSLGVVKEHPAIAKKIENNLVVPMCAELQIGATRRQDQLQGYYPYAVAYIIKTTTLLAEQTFYSNRNTYFIIKPYQQYEIDDIYDFLAIENIMKYEWGIT